MIRSDPLVTLASVELHGRSLGKSLAIFIVHGPNERALIDTFFQELIDVRGELSSRGCQGGDFNITKDLVDGRGNPQNVKDSQAFLDFISFMQL